ncbi:MAG: AMP-binding protein [Kiritimatiellae bacterium]|nr:AMP-binding protein [Kiritimatiellia bacterium]
MNLLDRYVEKTEFTGLEDFEQNFRLKIPERPFNFGYDIVDEYARLEPGKLAFVWADDDGAVRKFTFADMADASDRAAAVMAAHGVKRGDAVMLVLKNRFEFWFCILGCHKLGAVAVPATHMLMVHDLVYRFKRANVKMIVTADDERLDGDVDAACAALRAEGAGDGPVKGKVCGPRAGWVDFSAEWEAAGGKWQEQSGSERPGGRDPMLAYFSSGTTGEPKMVLHDYLYALGHIVTAKWWHQVRDGGLHYTVADTGWGKAVWGNLYGQWICGSATFVHDYRKFNAARTLDICAQVGITSFCAPPTVYRFLAKEDLSAHDFSRVEHGAVAGESLAPETYAALLKATGLRLMEAYGQTETTLVVGNFAWMTPKPGSMGKPSPLFHAKIVDPDGRECDVGEHGEMVIPLPADGSVERRPAGLFREYVGNDEATSHSERGGVYHTGDVAWRDEDGYFWYVGRDDDLIKSSGYRIGPFEVESALMEHPAVLECAVTGMPDPVRGQLVKATIVPAKGYEYVLEDETRAQALTEELQKHVKHATAPYKYPRCIVYVKSLPKTISGKIQRKVIRDQDWQKPTA